MRGCLFILLLAGALIAGIAWFGAPPIAAVVIRSVLESSGYEAGTTSIAANAAPPPRLLLGHADVVSLRATGVSWRALRAEAIDLRLEDVDLFGRTAGTVLGTIDGARVAADTRGGSSVRIDVDGPGRAARAAITADRATVRSLVVDGLRRAFGVDATAADLVAPDRLRIVTAGATIEGSLVIEGDHAVAMSTPLGSVPLLALDPTLPLRLTGVSVVDAGLRLDGILDVDALLS